MSPKSSWAELGSHGSHGLSRHLGEKDCLPGMWCAGNRYSFRLL